MGHGERPDFEEYARAAQGRLYRTASLLCSHRQDAQDVTQEALTRLFRSWHRASRADDLDAYARRALMTAFLDQRERRRREAPPHRLVEPPPDGPRLDERLVLLAALERLPPGMRAAVVLRFWEDQSVEATAAALGCSTGNVKSQTARGLAKLRELLQDTQPGLPHVWEEA